MNLKTVSVLAVAAALAVTAAVWSTRPAPQQASATVHNTLLPGLAAQLGQLKGLRLVIAGDKTAVELASATAGWVVVNKHQYPAALAPVRQLLQMLAEAKVLEEKTANPEYYAQLGVEDVSQPTATGVRLELAGLAEPLALIVGKPASSGTGTYVRRNDVAQSLLIDATLAVTTDPLDWLERSVLDIPAKRIQQATIRQADGTVLRVRKEKQEDEHYTLAELPAGRELSSAVAVDQVAGALASLRLDDVLPVAQLKPTEHETVNAEFRTFDGLVITAQAFRQEGTGYVQFTVAYAAPATATADDAVQKEAEQLQAQVANWLYVLPSYQYGELTRHLDDVLKPLATDLPAVSEDPTASEEPPADEEPAAPAAPASE